MPSTSKSVTFHTYAKALALFSASNFFFVFLFWNIFLTIFVCVHLLSLVQFKGSQLFTSLYLSNSLVRLFSYAESRPFVDSSSIFAHKIHIAHSPRSLSLFFFYFLFSWTRARTFADVAFDMAYIFTLHWIFQSTHPNEPFYLFILFAPFFLSLSLSLTLLIFRICCWSLQWQRIFHF